jgi:starch-binding outer membrane protein, SusD/RagB family
VKNYIIILISLLVITISCKKELGKLPENAKVDGNTILDERTARVALNGVYYQFAKVQSADNVTDWQNNEVYPSMFSGNIGYGYGETNEESNIYGNRTDYFWENCYAIINAANGVINSVNELPDNFFTGNSKQEIMGEARFLRAYANFKLLTYYGEWFDLSSNYGILLRDQLVDLGNIQKARSTVAASYAFIMDDADYAIANAPAENSNIYATKFTAMALKMRVLLSHGEQADYTEVISLADNIIAGGGYSLEANPKDIFYTKGLSSEEVMLGVRPQQNQEAYYYNVSSQYWPGASSLYVAKQQLKDLMEGDPRQSWYIGSENDNTENTYFFLKYIAEGTKATLISEAAYAFRLTEVYLLKAEAIVRSGGSVNDAKLIVKDIMAHAGVTDFSAIDNAGTTDEVLMQIYYEIVRSLVGEDGQEWMALLRLPYATVQAIRPTIENKIQYILPVPATEFLNNPSFGEQNKGYQTF